MPSVGANRYVQTISAIRGKGFTTQFCQLCNAWRGSLGLEPDPDLFVSHLVEIFREVWRVLRKDGTVWLNIGDSYAANRGSGAKSVGDKQATNSGSLLGRLVCPNGLKPKDMVLIPFRLALALQADGWWIRSDIIWYKPNAMPESVTDRPTKDFEHFFLLAKSKKYFYDQNAIKEDSIDPESFAGRRKRNPQKFDSQPFSETRRGFAKLDGQVYPRRNKRTVWTIPTQPYPGAHFAVFPERLVEPMVLAGSRRGDIILDPFAGAATTCLVATKLGRGYIGIEQNPDYVKLGEDRIERATRQGQFVFS